MGKRLIRIEEKDMFSRKAEIEGKEIHVVFKSNITLSGILLSIDLDNLLLKDLKGHLIKIPIANISECIYDYKAPY